MRWLAFFGFLQLATWALMLGGMLLGGYEPGRWLIMGAFAFIAIDGLFTMLNALTKEGADA